MDASNRVAAGYRGAAPGRASLRRARTLPVAWAVASRALTLPLWPEMTDEQLGRVVATIARAKATLGGEAPAST